MGRMKAEGTIKNEGVKKELVEGATRIITYTSNIPSRKMRVFYNPLMKMNRDMTILLLRTLSERDNHQLQICLPLTGSGVRAARIIREAPECIKRMVVNDLSGEAMTLAEENIKNAITDVDGRLGPKGDWLRVLSEDANKVLMEEGRFDYIDIDPFGSPNPFLESAIRALLKRGVLAVTATDTAALTGTYPHATRRKYWARSFITDFMHESALRILIRKIQLEACQYGRALMPVFSYYRNHYVRVFLRYERGARECSPILDRHRAILFNMRTKGRRIYEDGSHYKEEKLLGPLWAGPLWDKEIIKGMIKKAVEIENEKEREKIINFLRTIDEESDIDVPWHFMIPALAKNMKKGNLKPINEIVEELRKEGFLASRTHFAGQAVRTNADADEIRRHLT